jgi:V8-like Glu-specific endopeptidase
LRYRVDTEGGNSGSPVVDEATGMSISIHTNAGCTSGGGSNSGTSNFNTALWAQIGS